MFSSLCVSSGTMMIMSQSSSSSYLFLYHLCFQNHDNDKLWFVVVMVFVLFTILDPTSMTTRSVNVSILIACVCKMTTTTNVSSLSSWFLFPRLQGPWLCFFFFMVTYIFTTTMTQLVMVFFHHLKVAMGFSISLLLTIETP